MRGNPGGTHSGVEISFREERSGGADSGNWGRAESETKKS